MTKSSALVDYHRDSDRLKEIVTETLSEAERQGASAASATVGANVGLSVTVRMGDVETIEHHRSKHLSVTVYFGNKTGSATTTDLGPDAIKSTVSAAAGIARYTQEDEYSGLADAELMATQFPDLDLYHPWHMDPEQSIQMALECETAARDVDARITNSDGADVQQFEAGRVYGNSHGFLGVRASTRHGLSCAMIAQGDSEKQRDYWYTTSRVPEDLESAQAVGKHAGERTVQRLGARRLTTRKVPVIFAADQATRLFRSFLSAIHGAALYRQASFLLEHIGKPVFPEHLNIREEPHLRAGLGSTSFDSEGVATAPRAIVSDGILQAYVLDSYAARKLGTQTTGNSGGIHNLIVEPGDKDLAGLIETMGTGLLVTELMGMGVNIVTGDYSRGAAGHWVENGEIQFPVEEITIAGNLRDMFLGIQEIGNDVDTRSQLRTASVLIEHMTVAGD